MKMENLTIEIHGPRGEGKSTLAIFIRELINELDTGYFVPRLIVDIEPTEGFYNKTRKELDKGPIHPKEIRIVVCSECSSTGFCGVHEDDS